MKLAWDSISHHLLIFLAFTSSLNGLQVMDIEYPVQKKRMSAEEKLRYECEYYLHQLRKSFESGEEEAEETIRQEAEETIREEAGDNQVRIPLDKLLIFPRVKELAKEGLTDIRSVCQVISFF